MVAVVLRRRVFKRGGNAVPLGCIIVHKVGDAKDAAIRRLDQLEPGGGVDALPFAKLLDDVFDFLDLLPGAFPRIDVGNVDDCFLGWVQHGKDVVGISAGVEEIANVERSEEHTSELQSLMRISSAVFCLKQKKKVHVVHQNHQIRSKHN